MVLPPPGSPVIATAVGRLRAAASSGSKWTTDRARPSVSPMYGPTQTSPLASTPHRPVAQVHGRGRHAARDRVQRLALHVRGEPDPVAGQRLAQQRELVAGGVDHVDADVPVVLDHRLGPPLAQLAGRRGHHQPVPAVDERQPLLGDPVLQHPGRLDLLGQRQRQIDPRLPDVRVHVPGVRKPAARRPCWPSPGGISLIRELTSTGNGSESAKCSHGSPSGKT